MHVWCVVCCEYYDTGTVPYHAATGSSTRADRVPGYIISEGTCGGMWDAERVAPPGTGVREGRSGAELGPPTPTEPTFPGDLLGAGKLFYKKQKKTDYRFRKPCIAGLIMVLYRTSRVNVLLVWKAPLENFRIPRPAFAASSSETSGNPGHRFWGSGVGPRVGPHT
jgi:hypothetical protein